MNISNNISSIQAHQTMMNTSANNVANVNSDGFKPSDTRIFFKPCEANRNSTVELASTTTKAEIGESLKILEPTVIITFLEYVNIPTAMAIPPKRKSC